MTEAATVTLLRLRSVPGMLEVEWEDGTTAALPYRMLRKRCPCAECRQRRRTAEFDAPGPIAVTAIEPRGANAVQLVFSDGHGRGIFPFPYLRELRDEALNRSGSAGISK